MKKLKEVNWKKCENSTELMEEMLKAYEVLRIKYKFYFNRQQHEIADINRTLKNHNDWNHKINCYYNDHNYYFVIYKKDSIDIIYCDKILNNRGFGFVFLNRVKKEFEHKTEEEMF